MRLVGVSYTPIDESPVTKKFYKQQRNGWRRFLAGRKGILCAYLEQPFGKKFGERWQRFLMAKRAATWRLLRIRNPELFCVRSDKPIANTYQSSFLAIASLLGKMANWSGIPVRWEEGHKIKRAVTRDWGIRLCRKSLSFLNKEDTAVVEAGRNQQRYLSLLSPTSCCFILLHTINHNNQQRND